MFFGFTVPTLVDISETADMVVVGNRGRGAVSRLLLGSVTSGLVHRAHCPVAVIRDEAPSAPELVLDAATKSAEQLADEVIAHLRSAGKIPG